MRPVLCLLVLLVSALPPAARAGEEVSFRVVQPSGEAHGLLPKTCTVCHKDREFHFFLVTAPSQESLDEAARRLTGQAGAPAAPPRPANPHEAVACLFCHMEVPEPDAPSEALSFRTLGGTPVSAQDVVELCRMCHPEQGPDAHPRVLGPGDPAEGLRRAGIAVDGPVRCSTCHEMHGAEAGPADVRTAYLRFAAESPASFPHGNRAACRACHLGEPAEGSEPVFLEPDSVARCTRCHTLDHGRIHPVAVSSTERTYPMDFLDYPLDDAGRATCSTCHDEVCREPLSPDNPAFLRGGPYLTFTEFCYRCHPKGGSGALNPHEQVDEDGKVLATTCVFCHRVVPEDPRGSDFRPEDLLYLHSPVELCMGCHDPGPHPVGVNHLLEVTPAMKDKLARYEERHRVRLPLDAQDRVVCTTCHNPHAKGVLRGRAALGAGEENLWRVPSFAELCAPCHERYD